MRIDTKSPRIVEVAVGIVVDKVSPETSPTNQPSNRQTPDARLKQGPLVLITRRKADQVLPGLWELPGGKLEPDESPQAAVVREIKEEVGIDVTPVAELAPVEHRYEHAHVRLIPFICDHIAGTPRPLHVDEVRWVTPDELADFSFPDASLPILAELTRWLANNA